MKDNNPTQPSNGSKPENSHNDIAELRKALHLSQVRAQKLEKIIDAISDQITIVDPEGRILEVNFTYPGFTKEMLIGKPVFQFTPPLLHEDLQKAIKAISSGQPRANTSGKIDTPDGNEMWLHTTYRPVIEDGKLIQIILSTQDFTHLKQTEDLAARMEFIFQSTNDQISLLTPDGRIESINFPLEGFAKEMRIGDSIFDLFSDEVRNQLENGFSKIKSAEKFHRTIVEIKTPAGKTYWLLISLSPIIEDKVLKYIILVAQDITQLKKTEKELRFLSRNLEQEINMRSRELALSNQELQKLSKELDGFVHGIKHDLRSPLAITKELLVFYKNLKSDQKKEETLDRINLNLDRIENTLADLIEMIEHHANQADLASDIEISSILTGVLDQFKHELEYLNAEVHIEKRGEMKFRYISAYVRSIFYNLISNAIKYKSDSRPFNLTISLIGNSEDFTIKISDNGIGMDLKKTGAQLFKPFTRFTTVAEGTGLGLSLLKNIVERNGGDIQVESRTDKGTEFTVHLKRYLPVRRNP